MLAIGYDHILLDDVGCSMKTVSTRIYLYIHSGIICIS